MFISWLKRPLMQREADIILGVLKPSSALQQCALCQSVSAPAFFLLGRRAERRHSHSTLWTCPRMLQCKKGRKNPEMSHVSHRNEAVCCNSCRNNTYQKRMAWHYIMMHVNKPKSYQGKKII
ncbi:hypothetical protein CRENBAI_001850 [Crenichthys baileyi]|uniref:Uncharacterized protein n=1 Tax=Crenichthys baileyi TaxID=28760 RepID=A0AAV9RNT7_9TELE